MLQAAVFLPVICYYISLSMANSPRPDSDDDPAYKELSPSAFFGMKENEDSPVGLGMDQGPVGPMGPTGAGLPAAGQNGQPGYEHFDLVTLNDMSRQQQDLQENYALLTALNRDQKTEEYIIYNLCFCLSYMWRRGRQSIRKYFHLRDIYANHLAYEVGYITHVIMTKYQNMLELYQYSASLIGAKTVKITRLQMTHFHQSILQDSRSIVHLCNMLHELKKKYESRPYDPRNKFDVPTNGTYFGNDDDEQLEVEMENDHQERIRARDEKHGKEYPKLDKAYLKKRLEQSHKLIDEALAQRKKKLQEAREYYNKYGYMPSTTRTQKPMRLWSPNLDYGWSGEDDW